MNTLNATQILIGFYIATVLVNIIVSIFQLYVYHTKLSKMVLFYWISILFAAFINGLFPTPNYLSALVSAHLNIVSQSVLGLLLAEMTEVKIKWTKAIYFYFPMIILSGMLYILGFSLEIYAIPIVISCCAFPFFYASYFVLKEKRVPFTLTQKLFFTVAALMSIHFLDYPYFVLRPELFIIGLSIAFVFYHVLSIFIPMLASEHSLVLRNRSLQNEVDERVELLKKANHEIWQSSKRASFGRMAGAIVH